MIEVQAPRVTYHNVFEVKVVTDGESIGLVFTEGPDAQVYHLPKGHAEKIANALTKAKGGVEIATEMPTAARGAALL